jgi:hypothetical protein
VPDDVAETVPLEANDVLATPEDSLLALFVGGVLPLLEEDATGEVGLAAEAEVDDKVENPERAVGLSLDVVVVVVVVVGTRTEDKVPGCSVVEGVIELSAEESDVIAVLVPELVLDEDIRSELEVLAIVDWLEGVVELQSPHSVAEAPLEFFLPH